MNKRSFPHITHKLQMVAITPGSGIREAQLVQWEDIRLSRGQPGFDPGSRHELLGVKTWLSTLEIVNLSVFRMRQ